MQQMALHQMQPQPIRRAARRPRLPGALRWLVHLLFVQPVGRKAREERLGALGDRALLDIGLKRSDVHAAAWGMVPLRQAVRDYPCAGTLVACGGRGYPFTLVRLREAA